MRNNDEDKIAKKEVLEKKFKVLEEEDVKVRKDLDSQTMKLNNLLQELLKNKRKAVIDKSNTENKIKYTIERITRVTKEANAHKNEISEIQQELKTVTTNLNKLSQEVIEKRNLLEEYKNKAEEILETKNNLQMYNKEHNRYMKLTEELKKMNLDISLLKSNKAELEEKTSKLNSRNIISEVVYIKNIE